MDLNSSILFLSLIVLNLFFYKYFLSILYKTNSKILIDDQFDKPQAFHESKTLTGGGIFFQLSNFIFKNNFLFFLICIISLIVIGNLFKFNKINILIIFLLLLSNPQYTIYHKYYDPMMLILFLLIIEFKISEIKLFNYRSKIIFYLRSNIQM